MTRNIKLGKKPYKLNNDLTLLENEKCRITVQKDALTLPILVDKTTQGYLFIGKGEFTLDAIIDTPKGAIGKSLMTDLSQPFLMLTTGDRILENSVQATAQDISKIGYESLEDVLVKANDVFFQFNTNNHKHLRLERNTQMFAFFTLDKTWDILISKEDKLVFTSTNKVYIFRDTTESTELHPQHLMLEENGKTVIIGRNNVLIDLDREHRLF